MIMKIYMFVFFTLLVSAASAQKSTLKGKVTDGASNEPLPGAYVRFDGMNIGNTTDAFGNFEINNLKPGRYKIKIEYVGFSEFEKEIDIASGQTVVLNMALAEKNQNLNTVNVYGKLNQSNESSSRQSEKNANNTTNVLSARAMERSPDINAANALARVSAITIQRTSGSDEAYAIIRGLEPRYNNTLINGVKVTSPDPVSRFISLSIVPSDLLDRIEVDKTLTPEMEGDAIGGTVNLIFKDAPDHEYFKADGSLGYSAIFFNQKFEDFSKKDIQSKSVYDKNGPGYVAQPGDFSRSNLDIIKKTALPTALASITYGRRLLDNKLGVIISDSYQNQYYGANSQFNIAQPDPKNNLAPEITDVANRMYSTQQLNNGLSAHVDYKFDDGNQINISNVFLYTYVSQVRSSIDTSIIGGNGGRVGPGTGTVYNDTRTYIQHQYVENLKIDGKHLLTKHLLLDWAGVYSNATEDQPDRADLTLNHLINPDFSSTPNYFDAVSRIWQRNGDKDLSAKGNISYKTGLGDNSAIEIKAGALYRHSTRFNIQNEYQLKPVPESNGVKTPFTNIDNTPWIVYDVTGSETSDHSNYTAFENITAGYGEFKLVIDKFEAVGGVRIEQTSQGYRTHPVVPDTLASARKTYTDALPSLNLKYRLTENSNIRASYYRSIARPALYELVPTPTFGQATDVTGNPNVQHTTADNYDLRYELFPKNEEQFFIGGFYKRIVNPIEFALLNSSSGGQAQTEPQNFGTATVAGAEVVYLHYFGDIGASANYTYTYSNIKSSKQFITTAPNGKGGDTSYTVSRLQSRPLQGQAGNVANVTLLYKNDRHKIFAQLSYSYTSKVLPFIYDGYGYDYYQQPQSFLDFSAEKQISKHFTITVKANNLLNTATTVKINGLIEAKDISNVSFNAGFRYSL